MAWRHFGRRLLFAIAVFVSGVAVLGALVAVGLGQLVPSRWFAVAFTPVVVGAILTVVLRFAWRSVRPIRSIIETAGALADGDYRARAVADGAAWMRPVVGSFNDMARRLETSDEQRRRLLADLGHELRTPLTVVRGELEAMLDGVHALDPEHLELLLGEVAVMERLLEDLRTLSLTEAGVLALHREPTDTATLLRDTADAYRRSAADAGVDISVSVAGPEGEDVIDPVRIREVLTNLVVNGLRAMPHGGILRLALRRDGEWAFLTVADTGVGIPSEHLGRVFERFTKGSTSAGSGLGLTISRDLVEAHGGTIDIESVVGEGTTVTVVLPRRGAPSHPVGG